MDNRRLSGALASLLLVGYSAFFTVAYLFIVLRNPAFLAFLPVGAALVWLYLRLTAGWWAPGTPLTRWGIPLALVVLTALPRLAWISLVNTRPVSDFATFQNLAIDLAQGKLSGELYLSLFPHTLGYPAVLALAYRLFGESPRVAQVLNVVFSCGITLCVYYLGARLGDHKSGAFAGVLQALWPSQVFFTTMVASEAFFTVLMLAMVWLALSAIFMQSWKSAAWRLALSGLALAVINLLRPFGVMVVIALGVTVCCFYGASPSLRAGRARAGLLLALLLGYGVGSAATHDALERALNTRVSGMLAGYWLLVGANPVSGGGWNAEDSALLYTTYQSGKVDPGDVNRILLDKALERIGADPVGYLEVLAAKRYKMWDVDTFGYEWNAIAMRRSDPGQINVRKSRQVLQPLSNGYYTLVLLLAAVGGWMSLRARERGPALVLVLLMVGAALVFLISEVQGRYHYPFLAVMALLAGYGIHLIERHAPPSGGNQSAEA